MMKIGAKSNLVERRMRELGVRRWPVRAVGVLLLLEAIGLAGVGTLSFTAPVLGRVIPMLDPWSTPLSVSFLLLAPLAFVAAVGFLRLWPAAWLVAMLLQGLGLSASLILYFYLREESFYLYAAMVYFILMVFYLNSHGVRAAFQLRHLHRER
jgi:hypothetical protein